jgi:hypothetical protein
LTTENRIPISRLILVPAIVTLAVTLLRLAGELAGGSSVLFNRTAGGAGALIGIVWLVPVFGFWFGRRLVQLGQGPASAGRVAGFAVLAAVAGIGLSIAGARTNRPLILSIGFVAGVIASVLLAWRGWPALGKVLLAYGLAARIPVALVMLAAIYGNWGTHYDVPPPNFDATLGPFAKWVAIGLLPQLTVWITFTVSVGSLFGALGAALAGRGESSREALGHAAR